MRTILPRLVILGYDGRPSFHWDWYRCLERGHRLVQEDTFCFRRELTRFPDIDTVIFKFERPVSGPFEPLLFFVFGGLPLMWDHVPRNKESVKIASFLLESHQSE